jgi:hypothetical protein
MNLPDAYITYVPLAVYLSSFVGATLMKRMNDRFGRMKVYTVGGLLSILALVWYYFLSRDRPNVIFIPSLLLGFGGATISVCGVQLEADLIQNHVESGAFVYGALSFTDKMSSGISIFLLQTFNDSSDEFTRMAVCVIPGAAMVVGLIMGYFIDTDRFKASSTRHIGINAVGEGEGDIVVHAPDEPLLANGYDSASQSGGWREDSRISSASAVVREGSGSGFQQDNLRIPKSSTGVKKKSRNRDGRDGAGRDGREVQLLDSSQSQSFAASRRESPAASQSPSFENSSSSSSSSATSSSSSSSSSSS